jgi:RNA polymerase sigma-70 factor (ECF subfamily)
MLLTMSESRLVREFLESRGMVLGFLCALTRDPDLAEEVFQEVGLRVVEQAHKGLEVRAFGPWVREIARNLVVDHHRRRPGGTRNPRPESRAAVACQAFDENEAAADVNRLRQKALVECLGTLSSRVRETVERRYRDRLPLPDIAARIGWGVASVKVALSRARKALLDCTRAKLRAAEAGPHG